MKKIIILSLFVTLCSSCVKSVYELKFTQNNDTITQTIIAREWNKKYEGKEAKIGLMLEYVNSYEAVYKIKLHDEQLHSPTTCFMSTTPINIIHFKYVGKYEK